jgi:hypothetical protein
MGGAIRFLLGGALGAALGFLISQKKSQKVRRSVQPVAPRVERPEPAERAPEPELEPAAPLAAEPASEPEPAPPLAPEPVYVAVDVPVVEAPAGEAPAVEVPVLEPPTLEEVLPPEEPSEPEPPFAEAPESDVVLTPELLEEPLPGAGWEPSSAIVGEEEAFEEILPVVPDELLPYPVAEVERPQIDGEPVWPVVTEDELRVGPVVMEASPADDLKARIEETRRRIRRELEHPFVSEDGIEDARTGEAMSTAEPIIGEALASEPDTAAPAEPGASAAEDEADQAAATHTSADYAAMRSRIEVMRGRLKAKAFDAMMTGESALLGRDAGDAIPERPVGADVDSEIDQTIETTLREEES